ncbi:hypothetical protein ACF0H5_014742 [Mactra antiquata]
MVTESEIHNNLSTVDDHVTDDVTNTNNDNITRNDHKIDPTNTEFNNSDQISRTSNVRERIKFKTVAKLVSWTVEHNKDSKQRIEHQSLADTTMRRHTTGDVSNDSTNKKTSAWTNKLSRKSIATLEKGRLPSQGISSVVRDELRKRRLIKKFRFCARIVILVNSWWKKHAHTEVSQTHPYYMQYEMINDVSENPSENAIEFKASYFKANKQMRMSQEAQRILTMNPEQRTKEEAMIALRSIDCIADYPLRMQEALARHGMFQSYGPKRIVIRQGHPPLYFYFILYGTAVVATLEEGEPYARTRVTLRRGENFGELAIARRIPRQSTVLTMEYTEFLTIDCDTYENIFMAGGVKTIHDPDHNNFMRSMNFLQNWPLEKLAINPKAMEFCYFRRNTVMVKDSNISDWIYIVKSGSLKVFKKLQRCYPTVNKRTGNYTMLAHTDGYHSFMCDESDYHRYAMYNNIHLPTPLSPDTDSEDEEHCIYKSNGDEKENLKALPLMQRVERLIRPRTATGGVIETYGQSKHERAKKRNIRSAKSVGARPLKMTQFKTSPTPRTVSSFSTTSEADTHIDLSLVTPDTQAKRTLVDDWENSSRLKKKEITAADLDPEFVLVQILTKGQAFGIQQVLLENQPSLILVSGGAECVMLNKKFYKENIDSNSLQKLKQQISPYPSDEELQNNLQVRVNWLKYKKVTLNNLLTSQRDGKPPKMRTKDRTAIFK